MLFFLMNLFMFTAIIGIMITISSNTWLGMWMGLEINMISFITLLKEKSNPLSSESSMKYFLVQTIASMMFLLAILILMMNYNKWNIFSTNNYIIMIMSTSMLIKMGAAPFHFWFTQIIEGMNWKNSFFLLTMQKIAPMTILSYTIQSSFIIIIVIIMMNALIGGIEGLNQTKLRKIMAYSSINHMSWMMMSLFHSYNLWQIYFIIYTFISYSLISMLSNFNIYYLKQMYSTMNSYPKIKFMCMTNLMSLGGLPPFLGFLPKWLTIQYLSNNFMMILLFMIMMTLITLYYYLRIMYSSLILTQNQINFNFNNKLNMSKNMILSFISITGLIFYTILFNLF